MHDAVIVGGGLAGATTAIHLSRAGHSVLVLERARTPGRKACGEGLFAAGIEEIRGLGLLAALDCQSEEIEGVRFHAGGETASAAAPALGVRRGALDASMIEAAAAAGAEVRRGVTVRRLAVRGSIARGVVTDGGVVEARVVVGADGLNSRVRRRSGLEAKRRGGRFGITAHLALPSRPRPFVEVYFEDGYELYVTPVGGSVVNAAILTRREGMAGFAGSMRERFEEVVAQCPAIVGGRLVDAPLAGGPFHASCRRAYRGNVVLAGDAAGFFDGITGEGMSAALTSGRLCAAAIDRHLSGEAAAFERYDWQRRALVRNSNLLGRLSLTLGARPWIAERTVRNLARRPATFERLLRVNSGAAPLRSLGLRDAAALAFGV